MSSIRKLGAGFGPKRKCAMIPREGAMALKEGWRVTKTM
jgi:hypothetical protein